MLSQLSEARVIPCYNRGATATSYLARTCSRHRGKRQSLWGTAWCGLAPGRRRWGRKRGVRSRRRRVSPARRPSSRCSRSYVSRSVRAPSVQTSPSPSPPPHPRHTRRGTPPADSTPPHLSTQWTYRMRPMARLLESQRQRSNAV